MTHQYGRSPGSSIGAAPLTPGRSISPATDRSRSRSPSACSTHSSSSVASDVLSHAAGTTVSLNHLPAGRFVYGRRYLQPFEFSAFWNSAQTNRAGAPAASSPGDAGEESGGGVMGSPASPVVHRSPYDQSSLPLSGVSPPPVHPWRSNRGSVRTTPPGSTERRKYSSTGSRSDTSSSWRKKTVGGEEATATAAAAKEEEEEEEEERVGNPTTSDAMGISKSDPMAVPKMSGDVNNHTWPGGHRNKGRRGAQEKRDIDAETLMFPFGLPPAVEEERKRSSGGRVGAGVGMGDDRKIGKWVPRGRWTQRHYSSLQSGGGSGGGGGGGGVGGGKFWEDEDDALLRRSALSEGLPRRSGAHASELTRALSHPQVAI